MDRRLFLKTTVLGTAGAGLALGVASAAQHRLRVTRHRIGGRKLGLRVVHLTDLHVGRATPSSVLELAVNRTRRLRPDLVVLTGDYLNHSLSYLPRLESLVARLPKPCIATLGNHDHWSGAESIVKALERSGIQVLSNQSTEIRCRDRRLAVVGIDDGRTGHAKVYQAMKGVQHPEQALILTHYPRTARTIERYGGRLILSGHTHGGQIHVPVLTRALGRIGGLRYLAGWYRVGAARLYVNAGIGAAVIGVRLGKRATPELALMEL